MEKDMPPDKFYYCYVKTVYNSKIKFLTIRVYVVIILLESSCRFFEDRITKKMANMDLI